MSTPTIALTGETRTQIENVSWQTFEALAEERPGSVPRMTYDQGVLELMSPGQPHEQIGHLIGRIVETYTEERDIEILGVASTTFKRRELQKAFEADESYYVTHAEQIQMKEKVDLAVDPPPDLVIEVEITSSAIRKLELFARMNIPEAWRHDGHELQMYRLIDAVWQPIDQSVELPGLTTAMVEDVLARRFDIGETSNIRAFRRSL